MKVRLFASLFALALVMSACAGDDPGSSDGSTTTTKAGAVVGPVFVDFTDILYLESFPVQVRLHIRGSLPTPCHQAQWDVEETDGGIEVTLWSVLALGQNCAQVLEPFEVTVPLGSFETADLPVLLNGEQIGRISIGEELVSGALVGAGWSFGMCGGYCWIDLVLAEDLVQVTGGGWTSDEPLFVNRGTLTGKGRSRLTAAITELGGALLDDVYGCPDCADGGSSYLVLDRGGVVSRHDMEYGWPPEVLAELQGLALAIIDSLEACRSDDLVTVDEECDPWEGF